MFRTITTVCCLTLALVAAGAAQAGITCQTDAAAEIAGANVNGPRAGWDPPAWTFDMPDLNTSVDVQAYTQQDASSKAQAWLSGEVSAACDADARAAAAANQSAPASGSSPASATSSPTATASPAVTTQATDLVNAAEVVYRGNSWGPVPLYTVNLPSLNMSIDVAANSEAEARANVLPTVIVALGGTWNAPASAPTSATPTSAASAPATPSTETVVTPSTVLTQPIAGANRFGALDPAVATALLVTG